MIGKLVATLALGIAVLPALTEIGVAQQSAPSAIVCDSFARDYAARASRRGQVLGGGAGGSLIGLGVGALAGASGVGAVVGATLGGLGGGAKRQADAQRLYSAAYQDCMAGRVR